MVCNHATCPFVGTLTPAPDDASKCRGCGQALALKADAQMEAASADNKGASPASPQGAGGAEGAGRASNDASRGSGPTMSSTEGQMVMAECWKEFTEETMRANIEYAKAAHNARKAVDRDHPMEPPQGDIFANWDSLSAYLCYMGYDPDNADGWLRLGIPKSEGPAPTIELIEDRFKRTKWVLGVQTLMSQWQAQDVVKARKESEGMANSAFPVLERAQGGAQRSTEGEWIRSTKVHATAEIP